MIEVTSKQSTNLLGLVLGQSNKGCLKVCWGNS